MWFKGFRDLVSKPRICEKTQVLWKQRQFARELGASRKPSRNRGKIEIGSLIVLLTVVTPQSQADTIPIAVASNFTATMNALKKRFESKSSHRAILAFGSTGKHYAQIKNGAPFAVFFAADRERPALLEKEGLAVAGSRFTYAQGQLVLWSPQTDLVDRSGQVLNRANFQHLAMANPKLAPYGKAAEQVLTARKLEKSLRPRLVVGENISQTFQFVKSGNAELGFVALAQVMVAGKPIAGSHWSISQSLYAPIEQQAVLLKDTPAAREFLDFVKSSEARQIIRNFGYAIP